MCLSCGVFAVLSALERRPQITWVIISAMTTTSGTPSNQRMIGIEASLANDPTRIGQLDNIIAPAWFRMPSLNRIGPCAQAKWN
jgi:hypothetical protein